MQNDFERKVQQKMEELNFVPSAPVWEKVEAQIREKRDRRRMFIWLPMLCLLLLGGTWWLNDADNQQSIDSVSKYQQVKLPVADNASEKNKSITEEKQAAEPLQPGNFSNQSSLLVQQGTEPNQISGSPVSTAISSADHTMKFLGSTRTFKKDKPLFTKKTTASKTENFFPQNQSLEADRLPNFLSNNNFIAFIPDKKINSLLLSSRIDYPTRTYALQINITDNLKQSSFIKKMARSKWTTGISAALGSSNVKEGFNIFGGNKTLDAAAPMAASLISPLMYNRSADHHTSGNMSFNAGIVAKKSIGKKLIFTTGVGYYYFSTTTLVGLGITQFSTIQGSTRYYINYGNQKQAYYNQYHFLSLPLGLEYRVLQNFPFHINAGLSVKQLLQTNALQYNQQSQVYYRNKDGFKKTQLFTSLGVQYAILKNRSLILGPQIEYGVTRLEKTNASQHLYSMIIKAQYIFSKK